MQTSEARLNANGLYLPLGLSAKGLYSLGLVDEGRIYLAGHGPFDQSGTLIQGTIGQELTLEEGRQAARLAALALIHTCAESAGGLELVTGFLVLRVFIAAGTDFDSIDVANAASEVIAIAWPHARPPTRTVVMCQLLPLKVPLVIEAIARLNSKPSSRVRMRHNDE